MGEMTDEDFKREIKKKHVHICIYIWAYKNK